MKNERQNHSFGFRTSFHNLVEAEIQGGLKMRSVNNYQSIRTPEDEEYERDVEIAFENLVDYYADDISEKGMNWMLITEQYRVEKKLLQRFRQKNKEIFCLKN